MTTEGLPGGLLGGRLLGFSAPALLALGLMTTSLAAQEGLTRDEWAFLNDVAEWLREGDAEALAENTDFERRMAEGVARGTARVGWEDLDELGQLLAVQETTDGWLGDDPAFLRGAMVYHARPLADPDAGRGPVPDRRLFLVVLKGAATRQLRELLVTSTDALRLLDLTFGEPYHGVVDPEAEPTLRPEPLPDPDGASIEWPDQVDALEKAEVLGLVEDLLAAERRGPRERVVEYLHRNPQAGVTALLLRLVELDREREPDAEAQDRLVSALETITGRSCDFSPVPRWGQDEGIWRASNRAEVAAWARWHDRHGAGFVAAPVPDPVEPTFAERTGRTEGAHLARPAPDDASSAASPGEPTDRPADPRPAAPGASPDVASSSSDDAPEPSASTVPKPVLRDIPRAPDPNRPLVSTDELEILWGDRRRRVVDVADQIPAPVRRVLDSWAPVIADFGLTVALSGNPDHVVLGLADNDVLVEAARALDEAWQIIDPVVPLVSGRRPKPTIALLFDSRAREVDVWRPLVDVLVERKVVNRETGQELRGLPGGVTARQHPLFLQPTWDMAGNAAAGDDEFRLRNELGHKLAQCLLTQRCGSVPPGLRWALGHLVENRLYGNVYQFNRTGFVATGDHFDWPTRARQVLEKRSKRREFSLSARVLAGDQQESSLDNALIAWAVVETLASEHPEVLLTLFQDLAEIHAANDPYGMSSTYRGDEEETRAALEHRLAHLAIADIVSHLRGL